MCFNLSLSLSLSLSQLLLFPWLSTLVGTMVWQFHHVPPTATQKHRNVCATWHGFRIGLAQVGSGQINGHHELQFESAPQVVQKGEVALEAKAIHGQLSRQWSDVTSACGRNDGWCIEIHTHHLQNSTISTGLIRLNASHTEHHRQQLMDMVHSGFLIDLIVVLTILLYQWPSRMV